MKKALLKFWISINTSRLTHAAFTPRYCYSVGRTTYVNMRREMFVCDALGDWASLNVTAVTKRQFVDAAYEHLHGAGCTK